LKVLKMKFRRFSSSRSKEKSWHPLASSHDVKEEEEVTSGDGSTATLTCAKGESDANGPNGNGNRTREEGSVETLTGSEKMVSETSLVDKASKKKVEGRGKEKGGTPKKQSNYTKDVSMNSSRRSPSQTPLRTKKSHQVKMNRIQLDMTRREHQALIEEQQLKIAQLQNNLKELTLDCEDLKMENSKLKENAQTSFRLKNYYRRILIDYVAFCDSLEETEQHHQQTCAQHPGRRSLQKNHHRRSFDTDEGGKVKNKSYRKSQGTMEDDIETSEYEESFGDFPVTKHKDQDASCRGTAIENKPIKEISKQLNLNSRKNSEPDSSQRSFDERNRGTNPKVRKQSMLYGNNSRRTSTSTDNNPPRYTTSAENGDRRHNTLTNNNNCSPNILTDDTDQSDRRRGTVTEHNNRRRSSLPYKSDHRRSTLSDDNDRRCIISAEKDNRPRSTLKSKNNYPHGTLTNDIDQSDRRRSTLAENNNRRRNTLPDNSVRRHSTVRKNSLRQSNSTPGEHKKWAKDHSLTNEAGSSYHDTRAPNLTDSEYKTSVQGSNRSLRYNPVPPESESVYETSMQVSETERDLSVGSDVFSTALSDADSGMFNQKLARNATHGGSNTSYDVQSLRKDPSAIDDYDDYDAYISQDQDQDIRASKHRSPVVSAKRSLSKKATSDLETSGEVSGRTSISQAHPSNEYEWDAYVPAATISQLDVYEDQSNRDDDYDEQSNIGVDYEDQYVPPPTISNLEVDEDLSTRADDYEDQSARSAHYEEEYIPPPTISALEVKDAQSNIGEDYEDQYVLPPTISNLEVDEDLSTRADDYDDHSTRSADYEEEYVPPSTISAHEVSDDQSNIGEDYEDQYVSPPTISNLAVDDDQSHRDDDYEDQSTRNNDYEEEYAPLPTISNLDVNEDQSIGPSVSQRSGNESYNYNNGAEGEEGEEGEDGDYEDYDGVYEGEDNGYGDREEGQEGNEDGEEGEYEYEYEYEPQLDIYSDDRKDVEEGK